METGKEIYKEYVNTWIDCDSQLEKIELNKKYTKGGVCIDRINDRKKKREWALLVLNFEDYNSFKRAPKTQIIKGHEVIAPSHDMPKSEDYCYWLDFSVDDGVASYDAESLSESEKQSLSINGWFDNKENAIAYAKAHRESK